MNHKLRTVLLILVWITITVIVSIGALWYGSSRSDENAERIVRAALNEAKDMVPQLIGDEIAIRDWYEQTRAGLTEMVPILQDYDQEEEVPSKSHMEKYAQLLGASWLAVKDPEGNVLVSTGKEKKGVMQRLEDPDGSAEASDSEWLTTAGALTAADEDITLIVTELAGGNQLFCQVSNEYVNQMEEQSFSWCATMQNLKLTDNACFIVLSQTDDTVLVHPDKALVGKTVEELGYDSMDSFLEQFQEPDADGIAMHKEIESGQVYVGDHHDSGLDLIGRGSGCISTNGLYVICTVPMTVSLSYILQQYGELIIFLLGTLLVLCYILFHFSDVRHRKNNGGPIGRRFGFCYDRGWSRNLILCCIIVLVGTLFAATHLQLLNNGAQIRIQKSQLKQLTKQLEKQSDDQKEQLNRWVNNLDIKVAETAAYVMTRDKTLQTRSAVKDIAERMCIDWVYRFDEKGRVRVTNSDYDHLDLRRMKDSRMARTLLPLLDGQGSAASTPYSENDLSEKEAAALAPSALDRLYNDASTDDQYLAYAGVSVRNDQDLCDGCIAIAAFPLLELMNDELSLPDMYEDILHLAKGTDTGQDIMLSAAQLRLTRCLIFYTALCLLLFCCIGTLRLQGWERREDAGPGGHEGDGADTDAPAFAEISAAKTVSGTAGEDMTLANDTNFSSWLGALAGQENPYFLERWKVRKVPMRDRSAEQKLLFILRGILLILFCVIVFAFFTGGAYLTDHSPLQDLVRGGWEKGLNLYAFTASEMIIIVAIVLCAALHQLVYFIARFSSPRGETICHLVYSVITYAAVLTALYYCLSLFGVQTKTLLASAGILGIVISFGAQKTIADILSGMFLIFEDAVHVGDWIKVGDKQGMVKSIGVRMTKLASFGTTITINNADLVDLQNFSKGDAVALLKCPLPIDYSNNLERVEEIIARELPGISARLAETGYTLGDVWYNGGPREFGDTYILLRFNVYCYSQRYHKLLPRMNGELLRMCERCGIKTAFPHTILDFGEGTGHVAVDTDAGDELS